MSLRFDRCIRCNHVYWLHKRILKYCKARNKYFTCTCPAFAKDNLDLIEQLAKENGLI